MSAVLQQGSSEHDSAFGLLNISRRLLFSKVGGGWEVIHHLGMVGTDKLAFETTASNTVDDIAINLSVSIDNIVFA